MARATKRSRPGRRRLKRKSEAWFPLRRPALELAGWAPTGAAFPPTLDLSILDGTNGFRLSGVAAVDASGASVSSAVTGDRLADLLIGAYLADPNGSSSGASYNYEELVLLKVPHPDSEVNGWRFRAPDLVWHKWHTESGATEEGFIILLTQLASERPGKPKFGPRWLQRFNRRGDAVGTHLDLDEGAKARAR